MKKNKLPLFDILATSIGEIAVSVIVCLGYLILQLFSYKVITGVLLGSCVAIFNFVFLAISTSNAIDKAMQNKTDEEMSEEEIEKFAKDNKANVQAAITLSYSIRNISMVAALIIAFISGQFEVIATVIPLLTFKPILMAIQYLKKEDKNGEL
jgi:hypothetical protein